MLGIARNALAQVEIDLRTAVALLTRRRAAAARAALDVVIDLGVAEAEGRGAHRDRIELRCAPQSPCRSGSPDRSRKPAVASGADSLPIAISRACLQHSCAGRQRRGLGRPVPQARCRRRSSGIADLGVADSRSRASRPP
jgi:hypothetical protein